MNIRELKGYIGDARFPKTIYVAGMKNVSIYKALKAWDGEVDFHTYKVVIECNPQELSDMLSNPNFKIDMLKDGHK